MVTNSNHYVFRVMVALDIWCSFFSESNTDLEIRKQQEIEITIRYLEELARRLEEVAWQELRFNFYVELCITDSSFETLCLSFSHVEAIDLFLNQVQDISTPEKLTEDRAEGINEEYRVTQSLRIPVLLTNLTEYISVDPFSPSPRILTPEELNTYFWLNETLSLMPAGVRRWLFPILRLPPSTRKKEDYLNRIYHYIDHDKALTACTASASLLLQVRQDLKLSKSLTDVDLILPSGMPVVWILRLMGASAERVTGKFLFKNIYMRYKDRDRSEKKNIYFISDKQKTLDKLKEHFKRSNYSGIELIGVDYISPNMADDSTRNKEIIQNIRASNANIVFIGLEPRIQEQWIATYGHETDTVVLGVGQLAPSILLDEITIPHWVEQVGLEWLFWLIYRPNQFWRHYLSVVPSFIVLGLKLQVWQPHRKYHPIALPQRFSVTRLLYQITEFDTLTA